MRAIAHHPRAGALAGAVVIAFSAILVRLADVSPVAAALWRCTYALPVLYLLATREGGRSRREHLLAAAAGVFFAGDLVFWHAAIDDVGAGLATVLANSQVAFVPLGAWLVLRERPVPGTFVALPLLLAGVVGISGVLEDGAYGDRPLRGAAFGLGTGITYAGFLLLLRQASPRGQVAGPLADATAVAAVVCLVLAAPLPSDGLLPAWPSHAWLVVLALTSQVLGWLLITSSLPRLPAGLTSILLTVQPIGSVLLGAVLLAEAPTALQLAGVLLVLAGLITVARRRAPAPPAPPPPAPVP